MQDLLSKAARREIYDKASRRSYYYMNLNGGRAVRPYVTAQHWSADGSRFLLQDDDGRMYSYHVENQTLQFLDTIRVDPAAMDAMVTPADEIFYAKEDGFWKMDWATGEKKKVGDFPPGEGFGVLQVTHDGRYLTCYYTQDRDPEDRFNGAVRQRIIPRLDTETGEWDLSLHKEFDEIPAHPNAGHPIINPVYGNLLFFCHEGLTDQIPDRLWLGDIDTGESFNLFVQAERPDGLTGETSGHEVWAADGEDMFFVKYTFRTNVGQSGLVRVDKEGLHREYINHDYHYWHCYPSYDKNWVAADTQGCGYSSQIVLVDTRNYESYLLADFVLADFNHPYQPHPVISPNGRYVSWQMADENGVLGIAWADISDLTGSVPGGGRFPVSPGVTLAAWDGSYGQAVQEEKAGRRCWTAQPYKGLFYALDGPGDSAGSVTLNVTYLDDDPRPLRLCYTGPVMSLRDLANREDRSLELPRTGEGGWRTGKVTLPAANLNHIGRYRSDFYIAGGEAPVSVAAVELVPAD